MRNFGKVNLLETGFWRGDLGWGLTLLLKWILRMYVCGKLNLIEFGHILYSGELEPWFLSKRTLWGSLESRSVRSFTFFCQIVLVSGFVLDSSCVMLFRIYFLWNAWKICIGYQKCYFLPPRPSTTSRKAQSGGSPRRHLSGKRQGKEAEAMLGCHQSKCSDIH